MPVHCSKPLSTSLYREYKEKLDLKDNNEDDTVSFNPRDYFIFKREMSEGLTGDEVITIPHAAILVRVAPFHYDTFTSTAHTGSRMVRWIGHELCIGELRGDYRILVETLREDIAFKKYG